jgi:hypothetical protein
MTLNTELQTDYNLTKAKRLDRATDKPPHEAGELERTETQARQPNIQQQKLGELQVKRTSAEPQAGAVG